MAWRRRRAGRKRKIEAERYPNGGVRHERTTPPDQVVEMRRALFGTERAQAETDWLIDRLWGAGGLEDHQRNAAIRLHALIRGRLMRVGAPRCAGQTFNDGGRGAQAVHVEDGTQDQEHAAALVLLSDLERTSPGVRAIVIGAVMFNGLDMRRVQLLRWALERLDAHFSRPVKERLALAAGAVAQRA